MNESENIMVIKINNTQNITYHMIPLILHLWKDKIIVTESRFAVDWSQRCGKEIDYKGAKKEVLGVIEMSYALIVMVTM